jgi:histidine triad (HIT) family protein
MIISNNGKNSKPKYNTTIDIGGVFMQNCIFCKIISGDIPSATIYEDQDFKVILDISPAAKGHAVILPKKHFANLYEMDAQTASKVLLVAQKVATVIKEEFGCEGLNVLQNNGEAAGQTVFHYHIHLIPRYQGDDVNMTWKQGRYGENEAAEIAAKLSKRIDA